MHRKHTHTLTHYANTYAVSLSTIKRWSARGINLDDPNAIDWEIIGQKNEPPNFRRGPKADVAVETTKAFQHWDERLQNMVPIIFSGNAVEGHSKEQTLIGHQWMIRLIAESLWKTTVLTMSGKTFEEAKAKVESEPDSYSQGQERSK